MCLQGCDIALLFTKAAQGQSWHRRVAPALGRGNHPRPSLRKLGGGARGIFRKAGFVTGSSDKSCPDHNRYTLGLTPMSLRGQGAPGGRARVYWCRSPEPGSTRGAWWVSLRVCLVTK